MAFSSVKRRNWLSTLTNTCKKSYPCPNISLSWVPCMTFNSTCYSMKKMLQTRKSPDPHLKRQRFLFCLHRPRLASKSLNRNHSRRRKVWRKYYKLCAVIWRWSTKIKQRQTSRSKPAKKLRAAFWVNDFSKNKNRHFRISWSKKVQLLPTKRRVKMMLQLLKFWMIALKFTRKPW